MINNVLDVDLVNSLIQEYAGTPDVIVYASAQRCAFVPCTEAFRVVCDFRSDDASSAVQIVASDFSGRVLIDPIGTGVGEHRKTSA